MARKQKRQPQPQPPAVADAQALGAVEIAQRFRCSRRTAQNWLRRGCPRGPLEGLNHQEAIARWVLDNARLSDAGLAVAASLADSAGDAERPPSLTERRTTAQLEMLDVERELKLLTLAEKRDDLVSRARVRRDAAVMMARIRDRLLPAAARFESHFPAEVRAQCTHDFDDYCRQLLAEVVMMQVGGIEIEELVLAYADDIRRGRARGISAVHSQAL